MLLRPEQQKVHRAWQLDSLGPEWRHPLEKQLENLAASVPRA
jgi:hypothetical protein